MGSKGSSTRINEKTLRVHGMSCGNCERAVTDAVSALAGVAEVHASHESDEVVICWKDTEPDWDGVTDAIFGQGFEVDA